MFLDSVKPYLYLIRLHRPLPILLILWPTLWALLSANQGQPSFQLLLIFIAGVFLMRSAGCILNDISDIDFDGKVKRTKSRPLITGQITLFQAWMTALALVLLAFVLVLFLNIYTICLSFLALFLAGFYPLCKRFFFIPQLILGLAFNFGVIMAYAASQNVVPFNALVLYLAAIVWTVAFDTIYALSDLPYDQKIGLKSSAVFFGQYVNYMIMVLQIVFILLMICYGLIMGFDYWFYISLLIAGLLFIDQYRLYRNADLKRCIKAFSNNHWVGLSVFVGIIVQYI